MDTPYYNVTYLGHSAWHVETENFHFLFDCQDSNEIDLESLNNKTVCIFFSHFHHDHYSKKLHAQCEETRRGFTFLGDFKSRLEKNERTFTLRPRENKIIEGVTVYTGASSDAGVCYMVKANDISIFFAGDHADWGDPGFFYYREIDYMASLGITPDIAFIPVCTFSGERPEALTRGAIYAVETLKPGVTFPMHANGREHLYQEFEKDLRKSGSDAKVVCATL